MRIFGQAEDISEYEADIQCLKNIPFIKYIFSAKGSKFVFVVIPSDFITHRVVALMINNLIRSDESHKIDYSIKVILLKPSWERFSQEELEKEITEKYGNWGSRDIIEDEFEYKLVHKGDGCLATENYLMELKHAVLIKSLKLNMHKENKDSFSDLIADVNKTLNQRGVSIVC